MEFWRAAAQSAQPRATHKTSAKNKKSFSALFRSVLNQFYSVAITSEIEAKLRLILIYNVDYL